MKSLSRFFVAALFLGASSLVIAAPKLDPALQATNKSKFDDQAAAIRVQMKPGGHWEFVNSAERTTVERRLEEISALLTSVESADALPSGKKSELLVAQEEVNAILTKKDGRRLICEQVAPTGSHRKQRQCETFAQRERGRSDAQKFLRERPNLGKSSGN